jgi:hypothetical protein
VGRETPSALGPRLRGEAPAQVAGGWIHQAKCLSRPAAWRTKGGCSAPPPFDPASIPHDIEKRGVATGIDQERNPQVSRPFPPSTAGHEIGPGHSLKVETRVRTPWDYNRETAGHGISPESIRSLNRDSNAGYPANIPHRLKRSECAKGRARRGWIHSPSGVRVLTASPWPGPWRIERLRLAHGKTSPTVMGLGDRSLLPAQTHWVGVVPFVWFGPGAL